MIQTTANQQELRSSSVPSHHALHLLQRVCCVCALDVELVNQQLHSLRLKEGCCEEGGVGWGG